MPTGYTAGILDGTIKDFNDFAKLCMRAFGATVHMRDEDLNEKYEPRTPSDYHTKAIAEANKALQSAKEMSDEEIISSRKIELEKDREYMVSHIKETNGNREELIDMLTCAKQYEPPTSEHTGIKDFMISQLEETIKFDGSTKYYDERLAEINAELSNLNAATIRQNMIDKANRDLQYHTKEYNDDLKRCEQSNKWVEDFINSLNTVNAE